VVALSPSGPEREDRATSDRPLHCDIKGKITAHVGAARMKGGAHRRGERLPQPRAELKGNFAFVDASAMDP